ncbi:uncharacterized protein LOC144129533 [Amblyomma americanum]
MVEDDVPSLASLKEARIQRCNETRIDTNPEKLNKPLANYSMICTVDCHAISNVPPDGLCDFILFDSLYSCGDEPGATSSQGRLPGFSWLAARSNDTQYGCSIDVLAVSKFVDYLKKQQAKEWVQTELVNKKVYHWGVMNAHKVYLDANQGLLRRALHALKEAARFSQPLTEARRIASYTFFGCYGDCQTIGQEIKSVFTPDAVVILGHISFQPYIIGNQIAGFKCLMLPPNIYKIPDDVRHLVSYAHTYYEGCRLAECLRMQHKLQVPIGVSFTLKGRLWVPRSHDDSATPSAMGSFGLFRECDHVSLDQDMFPALVCLPPYTRFYMNIALDQDAQTMVTFDRDSYILPFPKATFAFDNHVTYRRKVCDAKFNLTQVHFTLAAYDVNFDATNVNCPNSHFVGNYTRTAMLKKLSLFLRDKYTDWAKRAACLAVK